MVAMQGKDPQEKVEVFVEERQFDKAISLIEGLEPDVEHYQALAPLLPEIRNKKQNYLHDVITESQTLDQQERWNDSLSILQSAKKNLPESYELANQIRLVEQSRDQYVKARSEQIALEKGQYLVAKKPAIEAILDADPKNYTWQQEFSAFDRESRLAAKDLYLIGQNAYSRQDYHLAWQALQLSHELNPGPLTDDLLSQLTLHRAEKQQLQLKKAEQRYQEQNRTLVKQFEQAMQTNNLVSARRTLNKLRKLDPKWDGLTALNKQWQIKADQEVDAGIQEGRILYSQGAIQEALDTWLSIQPLQPANTQLKDYIARAQRFLKNLDAFSDSPGKPN